MRIALITDTGCEEACQAEVQSLLSVRCETGRNVVRLACSQEEAQLLAYRVQTARRIIAELIPPAKDPNNIPAPAAGIMPAGVRFKAEADVLMLDEDGNGTESEWTNQELAGRIGGWVRDELQLDVDLDSPDRVVYGMLTPEGLHAGMDLAGRLSKRDWRVMLSRRSLKATIAAATAVYAEPDARTLDPHADDGTLAIETALHISRTSPRKFDRAFPWKHDEEREAEPVTALCSSLQELKAMRMNSKLAGVSDLVRSTRVKIDWLDLKFEEGTFDSIVTQPTLDDDLFNQAAWVLRKGGTMTAVSAKPEEVGTLARKHGFRLLQEHKVLMGKLPMRIMRFEVE